MKQDEGKRATKLFSLLSKSSPNMIFTSILLGILAGLAYALIIPLVTQSIDFSPSITLRPESDERHYLIGFEISNARYAAAFFILCLFILIARTTSAVLLQWVAIKATLNLRVNIYKRILQLPIIDLEKIGSSRLYAAIANDVPGVRAGAEAFPTILINVATIVGLLGFLLYLNIQVFIFIIAMVLFGIITYRIPLHFGQRSYLKARENLDDIQEGIRGLIYGAKELKLNHIKRSDFLDEALIDQEKEHQKHSRKGSLLILAAMNYGNLISFIAIGIITFVVSNHYGIEPETLVALVMAMLYITGPLGATLNSISPVIRGSVALRKLNILLDEMPIEGVSSYAEAAPVRQIELRNIQLSYPTEKGADSSFDLGPINLTLRKGQVNFIVGGNGSGKSTLGKILSLHYIPNGGEVYFNDELVTKQNRDQWRQSISAIYQDFYLFTNVYGIPRDEFQEQAPRYLQKLGLDKKVAIGKGKFSTIALSQGQQKRLGLLVMYLENRDVFIFDEWAADQDPQFKDFFYSQLLKELKDRDKLVIVISHDDRYFHLADNIIRMEEGQILSYKRYLGAPSDVRDPKLYGA